MASSLFDSPLFMHLFPTGDTGRLFSDSAAIRAMLVVEGALAKAQGAAGIIPELSAAAIQRATLEIQVDPGALAKATGQDGVCVPALVSAFRTEMNAPEHAQYVHWGATSQDIIDTGLMLRLRQSLILAEAGLRDILNALADMAQTHAHTPMAGRTYGQHATPTTWGAVLAQWGNPLVDALEALPELRRNTLWVSLSGASGTASALGDDPATLRAALADGLGLYDPQRSWHSDRGPILRITDWMASVTAILGAMGDTLVGLSGSDTQEVYFQNAGASSTMPQKQNPVGPSVLVANATHISGLKATLMRGVQHQHQRDGAAWFTEWMVLPQIVLSTASALDQARSVLGQLRADDRKMAASASGPLELIYAEALSFALCQTMTRPHAQSEVKTLCAQAQAEQTKLSQLALDKFPDLPNETFDIARLIGQAPADADRFITRVRSL